VSRSRIWIRIAIPVLALLALLAVVAVRVFSDRLPEHTQSTIVERYRAQLEVLEELAEANPIDPCEALEPTEMLEQLDQILAWQKLMDAHNEILDDPVILGAAVFSACGNRNASYHVKVFEKRGPWWTPSMLDPSEDWPQVSLWYSGLRRVVQYEDRVSYTPPHEIRVRLLLDLEGLHLE